MHDDDESPKKPVSYVVGVPLASMSVANMQEYLLALREEILRVESEIAGRNAHRAAADALFG